MAEALRYFQRKVGRPLVVVWDRLAAHRAPEVRALLQAHPNDFSLKWLPPYSPDLNPEEGCNSQVKAAMRNAAPVSADELRQQVRNAFVRLGRRPSTLRGYFRHAGLSLKGLT